MRPMFEKEWFEISFSSLGEPKGIFSLPTPEFYRSFYRSFYRKYPNYESLSQSWLSDKAQLAEMISKYTVDKIVLSVGCGNGYVEHQLVNNRVKRIVAQDWSEVRPPYLNAGVDFYGKGLHEIKEKFDVIFASAVEYAMSNRDFKNMLRDIKVLLNDEGIFILISVSWDDCSPLRHLYRMIKSLVSVFLRRFLKQDKSTVWGWIRNKSELENLLKSVDFKVVKTVKTERSLILFCSQAEVLNMDKFDV
jgi:SAM-dependent methyltransferase